MQDERFQSDSGQPTIEIFDIPIMEPMVTFTDLWITAVCLFALFKLIKLNKKGKVHQYIRWYFGIMALATFLGGVLGHAFQYAVGLEWKLPGWLISMLAVMAIERASIMHAKPVINDKFGKFLEVANVVELLTFAVITFSTLNFFSYRSTQLMDWGLLCFPFTFWCTGARGMKAAGSSSSLSSLPHLPLFSTPAKLAFTPGSITWMWLTR